MNRFLVFIWLVVTGTFCGCDKSNKIEVLILSGRNNHDWKNTTAFLQHMYKSANIFETVITERPDTLTSLDLVSFDVVVSNWNSWPENDVRWPSGLEKALLSFIQEGGGFVTFHASSSVFYEWPEFKEISTAAWGQKTAHGLESATKLTISGKQHPLTKNLNDFYIFDELWLDAETNKSFTILAEANNNIATQKQAAIMIKEYGNGRIFHTILGHNVRSMRNIGFQTVMLRGTEWAATGKVLQEIPQQLQKIQNQSGLKWSESDTSLALQNGQNVIWQYNFNDFHGKPFFHPINLGRNNLTCVSPDDHPWHVGQWFSWKYINGVNYWEYTSKDSYQSEGLTEIVDIKKTLNADFSADVILNINYHPQNGENVLSETRKISVHRPDERGNLTMDYSFEFEAITDSVLIDRTPILGEPDGKSWGGYAGISIRFNQSFMDEKFISSWGGEIPNGKTGDWLYMGFSGLDGKRIGSQIIVHPNSQRKGSAWYSFSSNDLPFYYFSPAYLYYKPVVLKKGEKLNLNYRINHFAEEPDKNELKNHFNKYIND